MPLDPDLARLRDVVVARALKQYESRSETLAKSVNGLVLFALLFFFLILFPFISLHQQRYRISRQLQGLPGQIRLLDSSRVGYEALKAGLEKVKSSIESGPFELRDAIRRGFAESSNTGLGPSGQQGPMQQGPMQQRPMQQTPMQQSPAQQGPGQPAPDRPMAQAMPADNEAPNGMAVEPACAGAPASTEWMNCQVKRQLERQFAGYSDLLESKVIEPAQRLPQAPGLAGPVADSTKLRQGLARGRRGR